MGILGKFAMVAGMAALAGICLDFVFSPSRKSSSRHSNLSPSEIKQLNKRRKKNKAAGKARKK